MTRMGKSAAQSHNAGTQDADTRRTAMQTAGESPAQPGAGTVPSPGSGASLAGTRKIFHGMEADGITARYFVWELHPTKGFRKGKTERHKIKAAISDWPVFKAEVESHEIGVKL